ncbi:unnamed protein product [Dimorphilus gyrociliatus]|uniref:Uncharacterized protein n=1 Tax=Dimorphilus gyrociliatus TaxID=2664684 RepID=A0A7I8W0B1_9ANNE|nr:unnamed protein product [Dimorphilus gyrociliatus]
MKDYKQHLRDTLTTSRNNTLLKIIMGIALSIFLFHFLVLPKLTRNYDDPCFLEKAKFDALSHTLGALSRSLQKLNETYWLEYGTLVGFYRRKSILEYDHDIDLGRLMHDNKDKERNVYKKLKRELSKYNVDLIKNGYVVRSRARDGSYVYGDLSTWRKVVLTKDGKNITVLRRIDPDLKPSTLLLHLAYSTGMGDIPSNWILPSKKERLSNGNVIHVPNSYLRVIRHRYPLSWMIPFPYKWKCWLPWNYPHK